MGTSFSATFVGHHCWVVRAGRSTLLVDPLLGDRFGHSPEAGLRVYPPREVSHAKLPRLSGIFITHEHEGHFDLPSLRLLDKKTPVFIPHGSSTAMHRILMELGFAKVRRLFPGKPVTLGELRLLPLAGNQMQDAVLDEWDSTAYLVRDTAGHGSFFSQVDMPIHSGMLEAVKNELKGPPGIWVRYNDFHDNHYQSNFARPTHLGLTDLVTETVTEHQAFCHGGARPGMLALVGSGFSLDPESPVNHNAFVWDTRRAADALSALLPMDRVTSVDPGRSVVMRRGTITEVEAEAEYVRLLPKQDWPEREFRGDVDFLEDYLPVTGRQRLSAAQLNELDAELQKLAGFLYGRRTFKSLYSLVSDDLRGKRPTYCIAALNGSKRSPVVFEYQPEDCRFARVPCEAPAKEYLAVFECWASDLLAVLRAAIAPTSLSFARHRVMNHNPMRLRLALESELRMYAHPLRMPQGFLELYRSALQRAAAE